MKENTNIVLKFVIFILCIIIATAILWNPVSNLISDPEKIKQIGSNLGIFAPIIFIIIVALQILLAPIPGQFAGVAGGFIFGALWGTVYSMIGLTLGSFIAFYSARKLGRPFVEKEVNKKILKKFDKIIIRGGIPTLFLIYLLPMFPDDLISYVAGLTKIKIRALVLVAFIGRFPGFLILNIIGSGIKHNDLFITIVIGISIVLMTIVYLKRDKLEKFVLKRKK